MGYGVLQCFADSQYEVVTNLGVQWNLWQHGRHFQQAANSRQREEIMRKPAEIIGKTFQRIMFGIDGPDDFVQRLNGAAGRSWNFANPVFNFGRLVAGAFDPLTEKNNLGEIGAKIIVDVLGNPAAFVFHCMFAFKLFKPQSGLPALPAANSPCHNTGQHESNQHLEPQGLPDIWLHDQFKRLAMPVPHAIVVAGGYVECVMAGRNVIISDGTLVVCGGPVSVQPVELVLEKNFFWRCKTEGGKTKIKAPFARPDLDQFRGMLDRGRVTVNRQAFDPDRRRQFVFLHVLRVNADQPANGGKPEPSIGCLGSRRLNAARTFQTGQAVVAIVSHALHALALSIRKPVQFLPADPEYAAKRANPKIVALVGSQVRYGVVAKSVFGRNGHQVAVAPPAQAMQCSDPDGAIRIGTQTADII